MFENPRRGMHARNFTTNVPKILDLKSSSEQIFSRKLSLGAPDEGLAPWRLAPEEKSISPIFMLKEREIDCVFNFWLGAYRFGAN